MMQRLIGSFVLGFVLVCTVGSSHAQVATRNSSAHTKDSDRVLFEQAMNALNKSKYAEQRGLLERLINSYPESEYVARAKLSIGDAWYSEHAFKQAEQEYRDFVTFFPNMPEAVEAQAESTLLKNNQRASKFLNRFGAAFRAVISRLRGPAPPRRRIRRDCFETV